MQTIFWGGMLFLSGLAEIITIYFILSHDDFKRGIVSAYELAEAVRNYYPIEIYLQIFISIILYLTNHTFAFILSLPALLFSVKMLINKDYRCYALLPNEYKQSKNIEKISKYKSIFHSTLLIYAGIRFLKAFLKFLIYRIFGT